MQDRYFTRNGVQLRFRDEGDGPAVLWLHGWALDLQMWDLQAQSLRDQFRMIRPDRRGFGLSAGRPSQQEDVADLCALRGLLGLERVALVGMSQGARAAVAFALAMPAAVTCLVLDGPPNFETTRSEVPLAHFRELAQAQGMEAFRHEWQRHALTQLQTTNQHAQAMLSAMITRYPGRDLLAGPSAVAAITTAVALESLQTPTLIIHGDHESRSRAAAAKALARRLPNAESAVIAAAGHMPNLDNPQEYNAIVRAFLARHLAAPPTG
ncbi:MAG: alpha/beta hydrolase [Steroidobacteraceae bacterium]